MTELIFRNDMTVELVNRMGDDRAIVRAARVSTVGKNEPEGDTPGLINFLMKNRHGSPFEHNSMTFFVEAPIFVWREFMRHRVGWSFNETSGRYRELEPVFYVPAGDRNLVQVGKAGAYSFERGSLAQHAVADASVKRLAREAYTAYEAMLDYGIAKEVARTVLPVGLYSSAYVTCNARSLMSFLSLRTQVEDSMFPSYPQREIEMVAEQMEEQFASLFPYTWASFDGNGRVSP